MHNPPEKAPLVPGAISLTSRGFGFVTPDGGQSGDIFIPPGNLLGALDGDRVLVRINSLPAGQQPQGAVVRILGRVSRALTGTFIRRKKHALFLPDDKKIPYNIFIAGKNFHNAKDGQKVVVQIIVWPESGKRAEGRVTEILGNPGSPGLEILSIIKQHGLPVNFPAKVLAAAKKAAKAVREKDLDGRRDLRSRFIITIDSDDAKDLDDAVYVQPLPAGAWLLGVYIADVSYYVEENSPLDRDAKKRGVSVYLADRVLSMLPEALSNGICSLNAGEDRLALACEMHIDRAGRVTSHEVFPSVINVGARLSYSTVKGILTDNILPPDLPIDLVAGLKYMDALSALLRQKRLARGAIDFNFPESQITLDPNGKPLAIEQKYRGIAEMIIEEFMLAANETVAERLAASQAPALYRINQPPAEEKITALSVLLHTFSLRLPPAEKIQPGSLQSLLSKIAGCPEEKLITKATLRSLKQAEYRAENLGHFALAARFYTHFTSPIRRYPDLIVHRLLKEYSPKPPDSARLQQLQAALPEIAEHSSKQERLAEQAERDTVDLKKAEYMLERLGQCFDGVINSVAAFGLFVELANGVEGLLHISALTDDYYVYQKERYCLVGEVTKKIYRVGDRLTVEALNADVISRSVDFVLPGEQPAVKKKLLFMAKERSGGGQKEKAGYKTAKATGKNKKERKQSAVKNESKNKRRRK